MTELHSGAAELSYKVSMARQITWIRDVIMAIENVNISTTEAESIYTKSYLRTK